MASPDIPALVLSANGFIDFNPVQKKALEKGLLAHSMVVEAPTASGKTLTAELAALQTVLSRKQKVVYTCPLRALASEHYNDFKTKYEKNHSMRFILSTGDFDSASTYLSRFDLVFTTYEKLNSLLRHRAPWLSQVGLLIVDELHELDSDRGPVLEMAITQLRLQNPKLQILGLSATAPNSADLAAWLDARLVQSAWRPVKLRQGIYFNERIHFETKPEDAPGKDATHAVVLQTVDTLQKQALVFANTRKSAETTAKKLAPAIAALLSPLEKTHLSSLARKARNALEIPTDQCKALSSCIEHGTAFHHAGLVEKQRALVEHAFREGKIKALSATPTLVVGVNVPAHTVLIQSLYRYGSLGMERIPVREYQQMCGRAGRPKFDTEGRALLIARSETEIDELFQSYVHALPEPVTSKLGIEPVLRTHLLALIAQRTVFDLESMERVFAKTLYAHQFEDLTELFELLQKIVKRLGEQGFVELKPDRFLPTPLGARTSELFLDPDSAYQLAQGLRQTPPARISAFPYLYLIAHAREFAPAFSVKKTAEAMVWEQLQERKTEIPGGLPDDWMFDSGVLDAFFSAGVLEEWLSEKSEQELSDAHGIAPGVLYAKTRAADWLAYAMSELSKVLDTKHHVLPLNRLRQRIQYGVKEELLSLVEVRGIGRVRARRLWNANIRSVHQLSHTDPVDLGRVLGPKVAEKVLAHLQSGLRQKPTRTAQPPAR